MFALYVGVPSGSVATFSSLRAGGARWINVTAVGDGVGVGIGVVPLATIGFGLPVTGLTLCANAPTINPTIKPENANIIIAAIITTD
jgi:hypothetical protein